MSVAGTAPQFTEQGEWTVGFWLDPWTGHSLIDATLERGEAAVIGVRSYSI